jgi:hypothetical protein
MFRSFTFVSILLIACVAGLSPTAVRAQSDAGGGGSEWKMDQFLIYLGWPQGAQSDDSEGIMRTLSEAGFNAVMWDSGKLDLAAKYGLKVMTTDITADRTAEVSGHPALWGYHILDEPRLAQFDSMAVLVEAFRRADPTHPGYVNMYSWAGDFLRTYMAKVKPMFLSYDWYQWWWGTEMHYSRLEQYREAAVLAGVPLINWQEVNSNPNIEWGGDGTCPADNIDRLRLSVYTSLAYGVKGIQWFVASLLFERGTPNLSTCGRDVAAINEELKKLGPVLVGLRSVDVFNTPPLPRGTREAPPDHWFQVTGEEGSAGFAVGLFKDAEDVDYILIANRDYRRMQQADIVTQTKWRDVPGIDSVEIFDMASGQFVPRRGRGWFSLQVPAAQGVLLKIRRSPRPE